MIILYNLFTYIQIPNDMEFTIHFSGYSYMENDKEYESGDLYIQTPTNQYEFSGVLDCYDQCANIIKSIAMQKQNREELIIVNLDDVAPNVGLSELKVTKIW